jgi:hypothetical protein
VTAATFGFQNAVLQRVSQLDEDIFSLSNYWITLLLATTMDLLDRIASITVLTRFRGGSRSGDVGDELAGGEVFTA